MCSTSMLTMKLHLEFFSVAAVVSHRGTSCRPVLELVNLRRLWQDEHDFVFANRGLAQSYG